MAVGGAEPGLDSSQTNGERGARARQRQLQNNTAHSAVGVSPGRGGRLGSGRRSAGRGQHGLGLREAAPPRPFANRDRVTAGGGDRSAGAVAGPDQQAAGGGQRGVSLCHVRPDVPRLWAEMENNAAVLVRGADPQEVVNLAWVCPKTLGCRLKSVFECLSDSDTSKGLRSTDLVA